MPTPSPELTDKFLQALYNLTQTQTDTLAIIAMIVFLTVTAVIVVVAYLVFRSLRSKIVIPATGDVPAQIVSEKDFMGVLLNTFLDRIAKLNTQNDALGERLRESVEVTAKLVPAIENLAGKIAVSPTTTDLNSIATELRELREQLRKCVEKI